MSGDRHRLLRLVLPIGLLCAATPAAAEIGASLSVASEARFRAYSISRGRPVATVTLSYDDARGFYASGSATAVATAHSGVQLLTTQENVGFAAPLAPDLTFDIGLDHTNYTEYFSAGRHSRYTEYYVGFVTPNVSTHIYYSSDYFGLDHSTVYGEIDGVVRLAPKWRLNAHIGALEQINADRSPGYDWRVGVSTDLGKIGLQLALSGGGPRPDYYNGRRHNREALVFGASYVF